MQEEIKAIEISFTTADGSHHLRYCSNSVGVAADCMEQMKQEHEIEPQAFNIRDVWVSHKEYQRHYYQLDPEILSKDFS